MFAISLIEEVLSPFLIRLDFGPHSPCPPRGLVQRPHLRDAAKAAGIDECRTGRP